MTIGIGNIILYYIVLYYIILYYIILRCIIIYLYNLYIRPHSVKGQFCYFFGLKKHGHVIYHFFANFKEILYTIDPGAENKQDDSY